MESTRAPDELLEGARAMERAHWPSARAAFDQVLEGGEHPDALAGLGDTLWMLGEIAEGIAARERAFEAYVRDGRCDAAAEMAVWVAHQHQVAGRGSGARGWLARAERAV